MHWDCSNWIDIFTSCLYDDTLDESYASGFYFYLIFNNVNSDKLLLSLYEVKF